MLGATSDAVSQYEDAIRLCPDFLEATIKLGTLYLQLEQDYLAAQQFNKALEINDSIVDAYVGLTTAYKLDGKTSDAIGILSLAGALQPNSSLLLAETAILHFKAGLRETLPYSTVVEDQIDLTEQVIAAHRRQLSSHPQDPDLHYRLGMLLLNVLRLPDAIQSFQTALEINPLYSRARSKLAICLFETNRDKEAIDQLIGPEGLDADTLALHYKTALLYCNKLKFASSLLNLERMMEENFAYPAAAKNISIVLQNLGLLDRVSVMWENLAETAHQALDSDRPPEF
jgi:tetratricopeptide (TPR) repeat protein